MGMTSVTMTVKNPQDPRKQFEGEFLVDSGATFTVVPGEVLGRLGINPEGIEKFVLADGNRRAAPVMFGQRGDSLLLGMFTLEALGLSLDPLKRELYKATLRL